MQKWLSLAVVTLALAIVAPGCHDSGSGGKNRGDGGNSDGGTAISVKVSIVGDGEIDVNGASVCTTATTPCGLNVVLDSSTTVTAVPASGYQFTSWSCEGQISTDPTLTLNLASGVTCTVTFSKLGESLAVTVTDGKGGTGGVVTSSIGAIQCGTNATPMMCTASLDFGDMVTLTAAPDPNYQFVGWSGDCAGTNPSVMLMIDAAKSCTATFARVQFPLTLSVVGGSGGAVAASTDPDGMVGSCDQATCAAINVDTPDVVTLTAMPAANYRVGAWMGDCVATPADLSTTVTMDMARTCAVTFVLLDRALTVTTAGNGVGSVALSPDGTTNGGVTTYQNGTVVTLTETPDPLSYFAGWSGDCSGDASAQTTTVTLDSDKNCVATFTLKPVLTVIISGSGSVVSAPTGIDTTAGNAQSPFDLGTTVTLTATPNTGTTQISFVGWTGDCSGTNPVVTVTLDGDKTCTAQFTITPYNLTVDVLPTGAGTVTGKIGAGSQIINCSGSGAVDCTEAAIPSDQTVTLTATPASGYRFGVWSGCSTAATATLAVPMTNNKTCVAHFVKQWNVTVTSLTGPGTVTIDRSSTTLNPDQTCSASGCKQVVDATENVTIVAVPGTNVVIDAFTCSAGVASGGTTYTVATPTADVNCTVAFHQKYQVTVTAVGAGGGTVGSAPAGINACTSAGGTCGALFRQGDSLVLTATPATNYQVAWTATAGGTCNGVVTNGTGQAKVMTWTALDGAKACTATFSLISVTLTGTAGANGTVAPATQTVSSGSASMQIKATPATDYQIAAWTGTFVAGSATTATGCGGTAASVTVTLTGAVPGTIYDCKATFSQISVTLTGSHNANGSVAPTTPQTVLSGGTGGTITATPATNYQVSGWVGTFTAGSATTVSGCSGTATSVTVTFSGAAPGTSYDCKASFALVVVTLTSSGDVHGSIDTASQSVTSGGAGGPIKATPVANYQVTGWNGSFTSGSATTVSGCGGASPTVTVSFVGAAPGTVYLCKPVFGQISVNVQGLVAATGGGTIMAPTLATTLSGGTTGAALTAAPSTTFAVMSWSGAFATGTVGSPTASGCGGTGTSVTVFIANAAPGVTTTYNCTVTFIKKTHHLTLKLTAAGEDLSMVNGPGTVSAGAVSCSSSSCAPFVVDEGAVLNFTVTGLQDPTKDADFDFVSWSGCINSPTASQMLTMPAIDTTCTIDFRRYWSRVYGNDHNTFDPFNRWSSYSDETAQSVVATPTGHLVVAGRSTKFGYPEPNYRLPANNGDLTKGQLASYTEDSNVVWNYGGRLMTFESVVRNGNDGYALLGDFYGDAGVGLGSQFMSAAFIFNESDPTVAAAAPATPVIYPTKKGTGSDGSDSWTWIASGSRGPAGDKGYLFAGQMHAFNTTLDNYEDWSRTLAVDPAGNVSFDTLFCVALDPAMCKTTCAGVTPAALDGTADGTLVAVAGEVTSANTFYVGILNGTTGAQKGVTTFQLPASLALHSINGVVISTDQKSAVVLASVNLPSAPSGGYFPLIFEVAITAGAPTLNWVNTYSVVGKTASTFTSAAITRDGANYHVVGTLNIGTPFGDEGYLMDIAGTTGAATKLTTYGSAATDGHNPDGFTTITTMPTGGLAIGGTSSGLGVSIGSGGENYEADMWMLRTRSDGTINFNSDGTAQRNATLTAKATASALGVTTQTCSTPNVIAAAGRYTAQAASLVVSFDGGEERQMSTQCGPENNDTTYP